LIFVTVGAQMPFDRLIEWVDAWAEARSRSDVIAQTGPGSYVPRTLRVEAFLPPAEFRSRMAEADAIVGHAGMGTIITALELGKPILVLPRRAALAETRNDHQVATARRFAETGRVLAAFDEEELMLKLDQVESFEPSGSLGSTASTELIEGLRRFVFGPTE
jgi:UDP-N-acetylglucosamine transferase subunit ALG13